MFFASHSTPSQPMAAGPMRSTFSAVAATWARVGVVASLALVGLAQSPAAQAQTLLASSDFTASNENWTLFTVGTSAVIPALHTPELTDDDGNPINPFIYVAAGDLRAGFSAPIRYLGDMSAAIGGQVRFRMQRESGLLITDGLLVLEGAGLKLLGGRLDLSGSSDWVSKVIDLAEGTFVDFTSGDLVTQSQIERVLRNLDLLQITGSMNTTLTSAVRLDDVRLLSPVPEPAPVLLWACGLAVAGLKLRRAGSARQRGAAT
jgi:Laminin B (Domain IV)